jgi:hypothetical protein
LSDYVDYNKDVLLFDHTPEPIEEDKTWRLVGGNTNGIKPYGGSADLIIVMERIKLLQTGTVAFQETYLEWHNKGYQDEFQNILVKAFGASRVGHSTTKDKFETQTRAECKITQDKQNRIVPTVTKETNGSRHNQ